MTLTLIDYILIGLIIVVAIGTLIGIVQKRRHQNNDKNNIIMR